MMIIDYRSDTVTRPTAAMYQAIVRASIGDDVFGEDASVNKLEETTSAYFGMEAGLYCPSGTMSNQLAIKVHTQPGDEVICEENSHVYQYEVGGIAFHSGASVCLLKGQRGLLLAEQINGSVNNRLDLHKAWSKLVCLENTTNRGGGACYDVEEITRIRQTCDKHDLRLHLDGARLWNAIVAKKENPIRYGQLFDTISVCFSKGLGAPVGSMLLGSRTLIEKARRYRKLFGGGMRQAGIMAAACQHAMDNHISRLEEDHLKAKKIGETLSQQDWVHALLPIETNIIIFELAGNTAKSLVEILHKKQILAYAIAPNKVRLVTHLDIDDKMVTYTCQALEEIEMQ
jgi:threonine aldolase